MHAVKKTNRQANLAPACVQVFCGMDNIHREPLQYATGLAVKKGLAPWTSSQPRFLLNCDLLAILPPFGRSSLERLVMSQSEKLSMARKRVLIPRDNVVAPHS